MLANPDARREASADLRDGSLVDPADHSLPDAGQSHRRRGPHVHRRDPAQAGRRSRSRRLATVLLDSNDAVTVHDFDGKITAWNRGAERMFGYSEAEALQMNVEQMIPEELHARDPRRLGAAAAGRTRQFLGIAAETQGRSYPRRLGDRHRVMG